MQQTQAMPGPMGFLSEDKGEGTGEQVRPEDLRFSVWPHYTKRVFSREHQRCG